MSLSRYLTIIDDYPFAILFSTACELRRPARLDSPSLLDECDVGHSVIWHMNQDRQVDDLLAGDMRLQKTHSGLAWAANRSAFEGLGFYDACVVGSGNRAMLCAALGRFDAAISYLSMNRLWAEHYKSWAKRHFERVGGRVGCLDATVFALWHGDIVQRRYAERHRDFARHEFNPSRDITIGKNECWEWASDKRAMHEFVRRYFKERREDG